MEHFDNHVCRAERDRLQKAPSLLAPQGLAQKNILSFFSFFFLFFLHLKKCNVIYFTTNTYINNIRLKLEY